MRVLRTLRLIMLEFRHLQTYKDKEMEDRETCDEFFEITQQVYHQKLLELA